MKINQLPCSCHVCGEGHLTQKSVWDAVEYKGHKGKILHYFSICDVCGSEVADAAQTLENKREWVKFRKQIDRVPLGHEIAKMRQHNGLTQVLAGQLFGGGPVAFSKYEHDDFLPDEAMANLLYLAIHYPDSIYHLAARKNISLPRKHIADVEKMYVSLKLSQGENLFEIDSARIKKLKQFYRSQSLHEETKLRPIVKKTVSTFKSYSENGEQSWSLQ